MSMNLIEKNINKNSVMSAQSSKEYQMKVIYLKNYFWIIQELLDELIRNQDNSVFIEASKISDMPKSKIIRTLDDAYARRLKEEKYIKKELRRVYLKKIEIENTINSLDDPQLKYVLKNKYLFFKTLEEISLNINKSYKQVCRWHVEAINRLELPKNKSSL